MSAMPPSIPNPAGPQYPPVYVNPPRPTPPPPKAPKKKPKKIKYTVQVRRGYRSDGTHDTERFTFLADRDLSENELKSVAEEARRLAGVTRVSKGAPHVNVPTVAGQLERDAFEAEDRREHQAHIERVRRDFGDKAAEQAARGETIGPSTRGVMTGAEQEQFDRRLEGEVRAEADQWARGATLGDLQAEANKPFGRIATSAVNALGGTQQMGSVHDSTARDSQRSAAAVEELKRRLGRGIETAVPNAIPATLALPGGVRGFLAATAADTVLSPHNVAANAAEGSRPGGNPMANAAGVAEFGSWFLGEAGPAAKAGAAAIGRSSVGRFIAESALGRAVSSGTRAVKEGASRFGRAALERIPGYQGGRVATPRAPWEFDLGAGAPSGRPAAGGVGAFLREADPVPGAEGGPLGELRSRINEGPEPHPEGPEARGVIETGALMKRQLVLHVPRNVGPERLAEIEAQLQREGFSKLPHSRNVWAAVDEQRPRIVARELKLKEDVRLSDRYTAWVNHGQDPAGSKSTSWAKSDPPSRVGYDGGTRPAQRRVTDAVEVPERIENPHVGTAPEPYRLQTYTSGKHGAQPLHELTDETLIEAHERLAQKTKGGGGPAYLREDLDAIEREMGRRYQDAPEGVGAYDRGMVSPSEVRETTPGLDTGGGPKTPEQIALEQRHYRNLLFRRYAVNPDETTVSEFAKLSPDDLRLDPLADEFDADLVTAAYKRHIDPEADVSGVAWLDDQIEGKADAVRKFVQDQHDAGEMHAAMLDGDTMREHLDALNEALARQKKAKIETTEELTRTVAANRQAEGDRMYRVYRQRDGTYRADLRQHVDFVPHTSLPPDLVRTLMQDAIDRGHEARFATRREWNAYWKHGTGTFPTLDELLQREGRLLDVEAGEALHKASVGIPRTVAESYRDNLAAQLKRYEAEALPLNEGRLAGQTERGLPMANAPAAPSETLPTSPRQRYLNLDREAMGRAGLTTDDVEPFGDLWDKANPDRADVLDGSKVWSAQDNADATAKLAQLKAEHVRLLGQVAEATGDDLAAIGRRLLELEDASADLLKRFYEAGTGQGRALASRKLMIDTDMSLISAKSSAQAKIEGAGGKWTPKIEKQITSNAENWAKKYEELEAAKALDVERIIKLETGRPTMPTAPASKGATRAQTIAKIRAERAKLIPEIKKELAKLAITPVSGVLGVGGGGAEFGQLGKQLRLLLRSYIDEGALRAEDGLEAFVKLLKRDISEDLTAEHVASALTAKVQRTVTKSEGSAVRDAIMTEAKLRTQAGDAAEKAANLEGAARVRAEKRAEILARKADDAAAKREAMEEQAEALGARKAWDDARKTERRRMETEARRAARKEAARIDRNTGDAMEEHLGLGDSGAELTQAQRELYAEANYNRKRAEDLEQRAAKWQERIDGGELPDAPVRPAYTKSAKVRKLEGELDALKERHAQIVKNNMPRTWAEKLSDWITEGKLWNPISRMYDFASGLSQTVDRILVSGNVAALTSPVLDKMVTEGAGGRVGSFLEPAKLARVLKATRESPMWRKWIGEGKFGSRGPGGLVAGMTDVVSSRVFLYHAALDDMAFNLARSEVGTLGKDAVKARALELLADPTADMMDAAAAEALASTFNSKTGLRSGIDAFKAAAKRQMSKWPGGWPGQLGGDVVGFVIDTAGRFANVMANVAKDRAARGLVDIGGVSIGAPAGVWLSGGETLGRLIAKSPTRAADVRRISMLFGKGATGYALWRMGYDVLWPYLHPTVKAPNEESTFLYTDQEGLSDALKQIGSFFSPLINGAAARWIDEAPLRPEGAQKKYWPGALSAKEKKALKFRLHMDTLTSTPTTTSLSNWADVFNGDQGTAQRGLGKILGNQVPAPLKIGAERRDAVNSGAGFFGKAPDRDATPKNPKPPIPGEPTMTEDEIELMRIFGVVFRNLPGLRERLPKETPKVVDAPPEVKSRLFERGRLIAEEQKARKAREAAGLGPR